jgi:hypothetical protein
MAMNGRGFSLAMVATVIIAVSISISGCSVVSACPAVGYMYTGPAVLVFPQPLPSQASVAACFGEECTPVELPRSDAQRWNVPQKSPYIADGMVGDGSEKTVHVVVTNGDGTILSDEAHEIPVAVESTGILGQCGGPFEFEPVSISVPN